MKTKVGQAVPPVLAATAKRSADNRLVDRLSKSQRLKADARRDIFMVAAFAVALASLDRLCIIMQSIVASLLDWSIPGENVLSRRVGFWEEV